MKKQIDRHNDGQTDRQIHPHTHRPTHRPTSTEGNKQKDGQIGTHTE